MGRLALVFALALVCCGDSETSSSGVGGSQGGAGGSVECDVDGDGVDSQACGGDDCCDTDASVPSNDFHDTAHGCGSFDYDCDGSIDEEIDNLGEQCPAMGACGAPVTGWEAIKPQCGETGTWIMSCFVDPPMGCVTDKDERTQRCR